MTEAQATRPIRIQIVEDERVVALDLKLNLQSLGFDVSGVAASEVQALEQVKAQRPDLVLMDINLGRGGDGTAAARQVMERFQIPVVYLTAYGEPETLRRACDTAPYGYLLKPYELRELNATIYMALARRDTESVGERLRRRYRLALDAARLGVFEYGARQRELDLDGHLHPLHLEDGEGFSMSREDFLGRLEPLAGERLAALLSPGQTLHMVARWRQDEDRTVWLEIHACHFAEEGRVVGVFRDVSEQWQAQLRLRQAAVVFDAAADAILILDEQQRVCAANPSFSALTGWGLDDVLGLRPADFLHAQRQEDHGLMQDDPLTGARHGEVVCRARDGGVFPAWEHLAPVAGDAGGVVNHVLSFTDISALRRAETQIEHLAFHDALTGLGNRHHLDLRLRQLIQTEGADGQPPRFALLFIDLDGFKTINDTLGHAMGDQLLLALAQRLAGALRRSDAAIRLGGDEFVVLIGSAARLEDLQQLSDKLLAAIREPVLLDQGEPVRVSASVGIALYPEHADSAEGLVKAADTAMYAAKAAGRNCHAVYDRRLASQAVERMQIEQGLRRALQEQGLELQWQPIVDLLTGAVHGAEALLRWTYPGSGPISPERFIPIAEDSGLIEEIGAWVLTQACRQAALWRAQGLRFRCLAVNVSARQLQHEGFVERVRSALALSGLPAACLELELTESTLQAVDSCRRSLAALRELGVRLALDDFGTGFSSLSLLKYFPLDRLKIDKSFVRDIAQDGNDLAITRAIVALARALGLEITAEGVETEAQRRVLIELGVMQGQGWLYSEALDADSFASWVSGARRMDRLH